VDARSREVRGFSAVSRFWQGRMKNFEWIAGGFEEEKRSRRKKGTAMIIEATKARS